MLTLRQFQAKLLEIALLSLLKASGYNTIAQPCPPMVEAGKDGLEVPGRSAYHQIDGIADFFISPPLSHPHRLLAEGKFYADSVGIEVIRNAVGVLADVSIHWTPVPSAPPTAPIHSTRWKQLLSLRRYHYQYAVVSATPFTVPAEAYAFGHDVYLFPLEGASYFQPVIDAIQAMTLDAFEAQSSERINVDMKQLHQALLRRIHLSDEKDILPFHVPLAASHLLEHRSSNVLCLRNPTLPKTR
ncbi:MAG TPA: hypothetical protein VFV38_48630 [Ktedonobacteraceae bacterium]|nr:hypothetical protein [Ktedonobacteraceae bacterium]